MRIETKRRILSVVVGLFVIACAGLSIPTIVSASGIGELPLSRQEFLLTAITIAAFGAGGIAAGLTATRGDLIPLMVVEVAAGGLALLGILLAAAERGLPAAGRSAVIGFCGMVAVAMMYVLAQSIGRRSLRQLRQPAGDGGDGGDGERCRRKSERA